MNRKIFISYAYGDDVSFDRLDEVLEQYGVTGSGEAVSIIDPLSETISPGENWRESIKKSIQSASAVVVLASDNSLSSQWVNYEVGMADALNVPVIVVGQRGSGKSTLLSDGERLSTIELD